MSCLSTFKSGLNVISLFLLLMYFILVATGIVFVQRNLMLRNIEEVPSLTWDFAWKERLQGWWGHPYNIDLGGAGLQRPQVCLFPTRIMDSMDQSLICFKVIVMLQKLSNISFESKKLDRLLIRCASVLYKVCFSQQY